MGVFVVQCMGCRATVPVWNLPPHALDAWLALHRECPRPPSPVAFEILDRETSASWPPRSGQSD